MKRIDCEQDLNEDANVGSYVGLVHIGDLSYAKGRTYTWDQFGAIVQPVATRIPYMVGIGNYEYDYLVNGEGHNLSGNNNGWHPAGGTSAMTRRASMACQPPIASTCPTTATTSSGTASQWGSRTTLCSAASTTARPRRPCTSGSRRNFNSAWTARRPCGSLCTCTDHCTARRTTQAALLCPTCCVTALSGCSWKYCVLDAYERTCPVYQDNCRHKRLDDDGQEKALATTHIMIGSAGAELDDLDYMRLAGA